MYQWATLLMVLGIWSTFWIPSLINALVVGRQYVGLGDVVIVSPLAGQANNALLAASIGLVVVALLDSALHRARLRLGNVLLAILPWACVYLVDALSVGGVPWQAWIFPPVMTVLSIAHIPSVTVYRTVRNLTLFIAALSVVLGLLPGQPGMMLEGFHGGNDKAIIGTTILAGPFGHSNQLGLNMALGLPFVAWTTRGFNRILSLGLVVLVLVWSASRTSIIVAAAVLLLTIITLWARRGLSRGLVVAGAIVALAAMLLVPLVTQNPAAFTGRGGIWQAGLESFSASPLTGDPADAFMVDSDLSHRIGNIINTGHNVFVTVAAIGGVIGLIGFFVAYVALVRRGARKFENDVLPLLGVATVLLLSVVEDPLRALILAPTSAIVWPLISIVLRAEEPGELERTGEVLGVSARLIGLEKFFFGLGGVVAIFALPIYLLVE